MREEGERIQGLRRAKGASVPVEGIPLPRRLVWTVVLVALLLAGCSSSNDSSGSGGGGASTSNPILLQSLSISPTGVVLLPGASLPLTAVGQFTNGSVASLASGVTWSVDNPAIATVSATGVLTGVSPGVVTVQVTSGGVVGQQQYTVAAGALVSLAVTPNPQNIVAGATQQFTATGTLSNGQTANLTSSATWSSDSANATVNATGLVTGVSAGPAVISATAFGLTGQANVTVTAPQVASLQILPNPALGAPNSLRQMACFGTLTNGQVVDLTATVAWTSDAAGQTVIRAQHAASGQNAQTDYVVDDFYYLGTGLDAVPFRADGVGAVTFSPSLFVAPFTFNNTLATLHPVGTYLFGKRSNALSATVEVRRLDPRNGRQFAQANLVLPLPSNQIAVHPTGRALYGSAAAGVALLPLDPFRIVASGAGQVVPLEFIQGGLAVNPAGTFLYAGTLSDQDGVTPQLSVLPLDPATGLVTGPAVRVDNMPLPTTLGLTFTPDGTRMYLHDGVTTTLFALDAGGLPVLPGTVQVDASNESASSLAFNQAGTRAYAGRSLFGGPFFNAVDYTVDGEPAPWLPCLPGPSS